VASDEANPAVHPPELVPRRLGVSVSASSELGRLGLVENHLRFTLGEVARAVLNVRHTLVYGGHLRRDGYTTFLMREMERFARADQPLMLCISWHEHRTRSLSELEALEEDLELKGEFVYLDERGCPIEKSKGRGEQPVPVDDQTQATALTALRAFMATTTDARILLGGKERDFAGTMPGLMEEAILAVRRRQPLFLAGGFGGATSSIAQVALQMDARWPPARTWESVDPSVEEGLSELRVAISDAEWHASSNGLSETENRRLAVTHRPSEVASLVALGMRRMQAHTGNR